MRRKNHKSSKRDQGQLQRPPLRSPVRYSLPVCMLTSVPCVWRVWALTMTERAFGCVPLRHHGVVFVMALLTDYVTEVGLMAFALLQVMGT
jgi:hypothetical protein